MKAPKTILLKLIGMKSPQVGDIFWSGTEIRNAVIDFEGCEFPTYEKEYDPEDQNKELVEACKLALKHMPAYIVGGEQEKDRAAIVAVLTKAGVSL